MTGNSAPTQTFCGRCNHPMHWRVCGAGLNFTRCECRNDVAYAELPPLFANDVDVAYEAGVEDERNSRFRRRSSSKVVLLALGVGAALGFVAGWVAR